MYKMHSVVHPTLKASCMHQPLLHIVQYLRNGIVHYSVIHVHVHTCMYMHVHVCTINYYRQCNYHNFVVKLWDYINHIMENESGF